jgi:type I restriction enzyme S subunit
MNDKIRLKQTFFNKSPSDWKIIKVLDFCDFERGTEPGSKSYNREGEGVLFIRVGNIAAQIQEQIYTTSRNIKLCDENDILIALDGSPGVVVRGFKGAHSSGIRKVIVKQPDKLLKDFVYFVLQADSVQKIIEKYATGMTIKHASKSLEHLEIPLPPLPEQKKIVYVLDSIQDAIRAQEKIIEKTRELKKSFLNEIFNSKVKNQKSKVKFKIQRWVNLGIICQPRKEQVLPKATDRYIGLEHLDSGEITIQRFGNGSDVRSLKNKFYPRDILYGKLRPYLDKAALANFEGISSTDLLVLVCDRKKVLFEYLIHILHLPEFVNFAINTTTGTNHPRTSWEALKIFKVPLMSLPEQREVADTLQTIDQKIEIERKKKALYEELFKTMLNKLMIGEIRVDNLKL